MEMKQGKYNVISYIRIMACLMIIRGHYCAMFAVPDILRKVVTTDAGPVTLFFVISGFLAYNTLCEGTHIKNYYVRRFKRIVPPYYIILVACMVFLTITKVIQPDVMRLGWIRYFSFTNMLIPSFSFIEWNNLYGFWTMGCFPLFYLCAPFLYKKMKNLRASMFLFLLSVMLMLVGGEIMRLILASSAFSDISAFITLSPVCTFYLFVLGMLSAFGYKHNCVQKTACILGCFLLLMLTIGKSGYVLWGSISAIICLNPSVDNIPLEKMRLWNIIVDFLDRNSFNMYLLHWLIGNIMVYLCKSNDFSICILSVVCVFFLSEIINRILNPIMEKLSQKINV